MSKNSGLNALDKAKKAKKIVKNNSGLNALDKAIRKVKYGNPKSPLNIDGIMIESYVLEDGTRVISGRGMQKALHLGTHGGQLFNKFISQSKIAPFLSDELLELLNNPIKFDLSEVYKGNISYGIGYEASFLPALCEAIVRTKDAGVLSEAENDIANQAERIKIALSRVGIIALIDEHTGYQKVRRKGELMEIMEKYIAPEFLPWVKRFPDIFYQELYRLKDISYDPNKNKHSWVGHLTNKLIYEQLPKGVLEELRKKNPVNDRGYREKKHHQFLTDNIGNPHLEKQIISVITLMRISPNYRVFERHFNRAFADQQPLLEIEEEV